MRFLIFCHRQRKKRPKRATRASGAFHAAEVLISISEASRPSQHTLNSSSVVGANLLIEPFAPRQSGKTAEKWIRNFIHLFRYTEITVYSASFPQKQR